MVILGVALVARRKLPITVAMAYVGLFAFFHGHAHGNKLPELSETALDVIAEEAITAYFGCSLPLCKSIIFPTLEVRMINLADGKCVACRAGEPTLTDTEIENLLHHVHGWEVKEVNGMKRLEKVFKFRNFAQALEFTIKIGAIAEEEGHHPLIITEYGRVSVDWWTHKIGGLHKNDFIMAAKTDELFEPVK